MDSNKNSNNIDYIEIAGGSYMQHQRPLNPITSLSTPPIITTAYNNANYVNISNNLTGFPLQNIAAQCCLPNQQQYFTNDASNQNKIISVSKPNIQVNAPRDANSSTRPPSLHHQQERPESIVFLYQIPNDSKIYLVKCVEVSQLLDTDYHSLEGILHNRSQPQQQVQQNLKNNLQQHLQNRLQPQQSQPSQNLALYQQQQITLQQNQIRHHPYQQ
ncbi:4599_t:CDS:2, partial [Gigaspora rosea]